MWRVWCVCVCVCVCVIPVTSPRRSAVLRGVAPVGDVGVLTPTLFPVRGFNTHTFFCTNALQQSLSVSLAALCLRSLRLPPLPSPPSQTWHRLWVWPADDWLFCLKSRLSWCVRFIGQLVLRRRELMVIYISLFQVLWMSVFSQQSFDLFSVFRVYFYIFLVSFI